MAGGAVNVQVTISATDQGALQKLVDLKKAAGELGIAFNAVSQQAAGATGKLGGLGDVFKLLHFNASEFGRDVSGGFAGAIEGATGLRTVLFQVAAAYEAVHAANALLRSGFEETLKLEQARLAIASEIGAAASIRGPGGKELEGAERLGAAASEADNQMAALEADSKRVGISFGALADIFKNGVGPAMAQPKGDLVALETETVKLALLGRQLGIPYEEVASSLGRILNGQRIAGNVLARNLLITQQEVKAAKERGDVQELLDKKLAAFGDLAARGQDKLKTIGESIKTTMESTAVTIVEPFVRVIEGRIGPALKTLDLSSLTEAAVKLATVGARLLGEGFDHAVAGAKQLATWFETHQTEVAATTASMAVMAEKVFGILGDAIKAAVSFGEWLTTSGTLRITFDAISGVITTIRADMAFLSTGVRPLAEAWGLSGALEGLGAIGRELERTRKAEDEYEREQIAERLTGHAEVTLPGTFVEAPEKAPGGVKFHGGKGTGEDDAKAKRDAAAIAAAEIRKIEEQMTLDRQKAKDDFDVGMAAVAGDYDKQVELTKSYYTQLAAIEYDGLQRVITIKQGLLAKEKAGTREYAVLADEIASLEAKKAAAVTHSTAEQILRLDQVAKKREEDAKRAIAAQREALTATATEIRDTLAASVANVHADVETGTLTKAQGAEQLAAAYKLALDQLRELYAETVRFAAVNDDPRMWAQVETLRREYAQVQIEARKAMAASSDLVNAIATAAGRSVTQVLGELEKFKRVGETIRSVFLSIFKDIEHSLAEVIGSRVKQAIQQILIGKPKAGPTDPLAAAGAIDAASGKLTSASGNLMDAAAAWSPVVEAMNRFAATAPGGGAEAATGGAAASALPAILQGAGGLGAALPAPASPILQMLTSVLGGGGGGGAGGIMKLLSSLLGGGAAAGAAGGLADVIGPITQLASFAALREGGRVARFDWGGAVRGAGTGTSDSVPGWLSHGEHVWSAREVQGAGGHEAMYAMRVAAARHYEGGAVWARAPRLSAGGLVSTAPSGGPRGSEHLGHITVGAEPGLFVKHIESPEGRRATIRVLQHDPEAAARAIGVSR